MEGEINNFILVWTCAILSLYYCSVISNIVPKGLLRFITLLPVIFSFLFLPLHCLYSYHLGFSTVFCLSWVGNFKLLLLSFGSGPLSDPSLPLAHFIAIALLPIIQAPVNKVEENSSSILTTKSSNNGLKSPLHYVAKAMFLPFALYFYAYRESMHPTFLILYYDFCIYVGLDVALGTCAIITESFLGLDLDQPFNPPYLSTSIGDFWGRRWNLVSANILRLTIFRPIYSYTSKRLGRTWAWILGIMSTFLVSGLMHELLNYQIFRVRPTWCYTHYFVMQGLFVLVEADLKKKLGGGRWRPPRLMVSVGVVLLTMSTFGWIVMRELMKQNVDTLIINEYVVLCDFLMNDVVGLERKVLSLANKLFGIDR